MMFVRWRMGLLNGYVPTYADLHWLEMDS